MPNLAWIAGYQRSGVGRTRSMLAAYLLGRPAESTDAQQDAVPDFTDAFRKGMDLPMDRPRILSKVHFLPGVEVLRQYAEAADKVLYVVRDPRDIMISLIHSRRIAQDAAVAWAEGFIQARGLAGVDRGARGSWPQHIEEWTSLGRVRRHFPAVDVRVVRYEDLDREPTRTLVEIVEFLGLPGGGDAERAAAAVENASPDRIRTIEQAMLTRGFRAYRDKEAQVNADDGTRTYRSLADLGDGVEHAYQVMLKEDEHFSGWARAFGYAS